MSATAHALTVGDIKCTVFSDGYLQDPDERFGMNCIYIETGGRKILVDNGCGEGFPGAGDLVKNMAEAGIKAADITDIIFTHGHIDHVCGTFNSSGAVIFSGARYTIDQKEWDYILSAPGDNEMLNNLYAPARKHFVTFEDRFRLAAADEVIMPGIKMIPAPGHTPGNVMLEISSKGQKLLCIGDIIHSHREFTEPERYAAWDMDPAQALQSRREILAKTAKEGVFIFACHFPFPGLGHIREKGGVLEWEAV